VRSWAVGSHHNPVDLTPLCQPEQPGGTTQFAVRALSHALYGGADFGECFVTAAQITPADPDSWYRAWTTTAERVFHIAESCAAAGHSVSAREAYLRASNYYRTSYLPLFGVPVDDRLVEAFDREAEAFARASARRGGRGHPLRGHEPARLLPPCR
jgi:hypothetical protein